MHALNRRQLLAASSIAAGCMLTSTPADAQQPSNTNPETGPKLRFCLNTSTISGQKLALPDQVRVAAEAGYDAIEPWMGDLHRFVENGGKTDDLRKQIADAGLEVASAIGFAQWIIDDEAKRQAGLDDARRDMELLRSIGGTRIAAPPTGATEQENLDLLQAAARYRKLLELGEEVGIVPQLELWGFSKSLSRLGELAFVATEAAHPKSCVLPDVYHIYKGGSDFEGLRFFNGRSIHVFHMNDYPADPPRETINDSHRVFPGLGIAPLAKIVRDLHDGGFRGLLSLELFNREYWEMDPLEVARRGLASMQEMVAAAL